MLRNAELRSGRAELGWGGGKITRLGGEAEWLGAEKKTAENQPRRAHAGGGGSGHLRAHIM